MYRPTGKSYFAGGGFTDIGLMEEGIEIIQSLDLDKKATDSMLRNPKYFGHKVLNMDIKDITVFEQLRSDIIIGTYPCTKYTALADIHGTRTGDDLFLHFFRHIALERPEMYIVENVPGMKKFPVVMEAMSKLPDYYVNVFCPVDAENWLPQRRKRLILIGTRKPFFVMNATPVQNRPTIKSILEKNVEIELPACAVSRLKGNYRDKPIIVDPDLPGSVAPTCLAHYGKDLGTRLVKDKKAKHGVRPFTIREYARLQGIPDDYEFENTMNAYKLIGNGVPVPMARWIGKQAMNYFNKAA